MAEPRGPWPGSPQLPSLSTTQDTVTPLSLVCKTLNVDSGLFHSMVGVSDGHQQGVKLRGLWAPEGLGPTHPCWGLLPHSLVIPTLQVPSILPYLLSGIPTDFLGHTWDPQRAESGGWLGPVAGRTFPGVLPLCTPTVTVCSPDLSTGLWRNPFCTFHALSKCFPLPPPVTLPLRNIHICWNSHSVKFSTGPFSKDTEAAPRSVQCSRKNTRVPCLESH